MTVINLPGLQNVSKGGEMDQGRLAEKIIESNELVYSEKQFWQYQPHKGIWTAVQLETTIAMAEDAFRVNGAEVKSSDISGSLKIATGLAYRDIQWDQSGKRDVCTSNGVLHYAGSGKWELRAYRQEDYRRVSLPIKYDPSAKCPRFTQFVQEIFAGTEDAKERALALVELMGLTLTSSTEFEKAALLVGSGANGKSVTLRLLSDMLGEYVAGVNPEELDNRFQRASLNGKLANIVTELPEGQTIPDGAIKAIISGEACTVEHKHKDPFVMTPRVKIWIGTNHLPSTRDFSPALFRRFIILGFPNKFPEEARDTRLSEKLRAEIPGILNILLVALGQAFDRGHLTNPPSSKDAIEGWRKDADQVASFLDEVMIQESGARIASGELYGLYRQWADDSGIKRWIGRKSLTTRIISLGWAEAGKGSGGQRLLFGIRQRFGGDL